MSIPLILRNKIIPDPNRSIVFIDFSSHKEITLHLRTGKPMKLTNPEDIKTVDSYFSYTATLNTRKRTVDPIDSKK